MNQPADDLSRQRARIDEIDRDLVQLLSQRAECVQRIGQAKATSGAAVFVPHREQEVFKKIAGFNQGPMPEQALRAIWREIMSASFALERRLTICHFGQPGAFTHLAAKLKFGEVEVSFFSVDALIAMMEEMMGR